MPNSPLIKILADGRLHSGQDLAQALGVSRTAVWKHLAQLEERGVEIQRVRGQGYRLTDPLDLLEHDRIFACLSDCDRADVELHLHSSVTSTNDYLSELKEPAARFTVCLAEQQTAGRGRRGRPWQSPFARNLYLSLAYDSNRGVSGLDGLSLVIGMAVTQSLAKLGVEGLSIKWPNDIWLGGRKLAGILIELSGELQTRCRVVIGLGLNVYMTDVEAATIDQPWVSLGGAGLVPKGGRNQLAGALLSELRATLQVFEAEGFEPFRERWVDYDALRGRHLYVVGQDVTGVGIGIDAHGAYQLQSHERTITLNAGEVSVRASEG